MRVWILHNRVSPQAGPDEEDVLVQVEAVAAALRDLGHRPESVDADLDLQALCARLQAGRPDAVFNLVESLGGHGRLIHLAPSLIEAVGARMAGCSSDAIYLTSNKLLAKQLLRRASLPTPDWLLQDDPPRAPARGGSDAGADIDRWIVKSIWEDASLGIDDSAVVDGADAARALLAARAGRPGAPWFAEAFIEGREFNLALLDSPSGVRVLPPAEMLFPDFPAGKPCIVGYAAKWDPDSFEYRHTVRTFEPEVGDEPLVERLTAMAHACWDLFGLRGWARVDFRVDRAGRPWILEVNANPCLAPDAGFAAALERAGISFAGAIESIMNVALQPSTDGAAIALDPESKR